MRLSAELTIAGLTPGGQAALLGVANGATRAAARGAIGNTRGRYVFSSSGGGPSHPESHTRRGGHLSNCVVPGAQLVAIDGVAVRTEVRRMICGASRSLAAS